MSVLRAAWDIALKDLRVESRSRELVFTTLFFALTSVLVFGTTYPPGSRKRIGKTKHNSSTYALLRCCETFERETT